MYLQTVISTRRNASVTQLKRRCSCAIQLHILRQIQIQLTERIELLSFGNHPFVPSLERRGLEDG